MSAKLRLVKSGPKKIQQTNKMLNGDAICLACGHEWQLLAKIGDYIFTCPSCKAEKGVYKYLISPDKGERYECMDCGNHLFYLLAYGVNQCAYCGTVIESLENE